MRRRLGIRLIAVAAATAILGPAAAGARPVGPTEPIYSPEFEVVRLAELLGGAHYARILCNGRDDQTWRNEMGRLLALEADGDEMRRRRLVRAFNGGYQTQERRYRACDATARAAESALAAEGRTISDRLAARYFR